jgi:hypothetical protein
VVGGSNPLAPTNQVSRVAETRLCLLGALPCGPSLKRCILSAMTILSRSLLPFSAVFVLLLSGFGGCGETPWLSGRIVVEHDGKAEPIGGARVVLYPVEPLEKGSPAPEDVANLSAAAVTLDGGSFEFNELSSNVSYQNFELLVNWRYRLHIEDSAYYLRDVVFDLEPGNNFVEVRLKPKTSDVEARDGEGIGKDEQKSTTGAVRRN